MTPSDLLACAPRIAPSGLARVRLRKDNALGTLVPPGRDGKHLVIALDGKRGPPVRRLAKDVELVEREAPPPPKLEAACVNCGAVARLKCTKCGAVCWGVGGGAVVQGARGGWWVGWVAEGGGGGYALAGRERGGSRGGRCACVHFLRRGVYVHAYPRMWNRSRWPPERLGSDESNRPSRRKISPLRKVTFSDPVHWLVFGASSGMPARHAIIHFHR